jgi:hypothetical protein
MFLIGGRLTMHLGQGILYGHQTESLLSMHLGQGILYSHQAELLFDLWHLAPALRNTYLQVYFRLLSI